MPTFVRDYDPLVFELLSPNRALPEIWAPLTFEVETTRIYTRVVPRPRLGIQRSIAPPRVALTTTYVDTVFSSGLSSKDLHDLPQAGKNIVRKLP